MKRLLRISTFLPGLVILSLALVRCVSAETDMAPAAAVEAADFSLFLLPEETRTANDGLSTNWETGDRFTLFHKVTGTEDFVLDNPFTIDDPAAGHATGSVRELSGATNDWTAVYPYAGVDAPQAFPVTVGCEKTAVQGQAAYGSTTHLAGPHFPLYGFVQGVGLATVPTLPMRQLAAVAAVKVTNTLDEPILVDGLSLTAPEPLVGLFTLDLAEGTGTLTPEEGLVSNTASISVSAPTSLQPGATAVLYLGICPVALPAGSELTLTVEARNEEGLPATQSKTVTLSQAVSFQAGHIRSLSFGFSESFVDPEAGTYLFSRVTEITPGRRYLLVFEQNGSAVMACSRKGTELQLTTAPVTLEGTTVTLTSLEDAFTIVEAVKSDGSLVAGSYSIRQEDAQFIGVNTTASSRGLVFASGASSAQYWWKLTMTDGEAAFVGRSNKTLQLFSDTGVGAVANDSSGILPQLYRLVNEEETQEFLLGETEYGAYGLPDWIYEAGTMQLSLVSSPGSTRSFRIFEPSAKSVTQMAGIPTSLSLEDSFTIDVLRYERGRVKLDKAFAVRVIKLEGPKAWLLSPTGAGFIVKYQ